MIAGCLALVLTLGDPTAAYRDGRYAEAAALFEAELAARPAAPALLYNLGNCYYRLGQPAQALLYYRRAALRWPTDADVQSNLQRTLRQLGIVEPEPTWASRLVARVRRSPRTLLGLAALLQTLGLVGLLFAVRRSAARLAAGLTLLLGIATAWILVLDLTAPTPLRGVVLPREIALRTDPHADLAPRSTLRAGDTVSVAEYSDRWMRVVHPSGSGWTERANVGLVE